MRAFLASLIVLFLVFWFLNYPILSRQFDMDSCMDQIRFWAARELVYKGMFLFLSITCFFSTHGLLKALTCFAIVLIVGDLVDKLLFGITGYVIGDIFLIISGIIISVITYGRSRLGKSKEPSS